VCSPPYFAWENMTYLAFVRFCEISGLGGGSALLTASLICWGTCCWFTIVSIVVGLVVIVMLQLPCLRSSLCSHLAPRRLSAAYSSDCCCSWHSHQLNPPLLLPPPLLLRGLPSAWSSCGPAARQPRRRRLLSRHRSPYAAVNHWLWLQPHRPRRESGG